MELALVIALGAWFHILLASPMKVFGVQFIMNFSEEALLVVAPFNIGWMVGGWSWYDKMFLLFHISVSLIWAIVWFTESIWFLSNKDLMLTLSLTLTFSKFLNMLFWAICNFSSSHDWGSKLDFLTGPYSCRPYLNLLVQILSATFFSCSLFTWFASLLIK